MKANRGRERRFIFSFQSPERVRAFTLLELIVVVALLSLLVSLTLPAALRARVQSNESAAIANLRTLSSSAESFRATQNPPAYPASLNVMITSVPPYLDSAWSDSQRQGYNFTYAVAGDQSTYSVGAAPQIANISGINSYCVDQTGVLRRYPAGGGTVGNQSGCMVNGTPI